MRRRTFLHALVTAGAAAALGTLPRQLEGPVEVIEDTSWPGLRYPRIIPSGAARTVELPVSDPGYPIVIGHMDSGAPQMVILNGWTLDHEKTTPDVMYFRGPA